MEYPRHTSETHAQTQYTAEQIALAGAGWRKKSAVYEKEARQASFLRHAVQKFRLKRRAAEMRAIAEQGEERVERIMATDIDKTIEGLMGLFKKKIPKFGEDEGQFSSLLMGVSWKTEGNGKRVIELQGDSYIEAGIHDRHKVVLVEGEEPKAYHGLYFYDFEEGAARPVQYNHVTDEFRAKDIIIGECQVWSNLLNDPESTLSKELARQPVASN